MDPEQLSKIDRRLIIIETLVAERNKVSEERFDEILIELREIKTQVTNLRIRTAGISAVIALAVTLLTHKLF